MSRIIPEDIELPRGLMGKEVNICLLQLKSPFFDELSPTKIGHQKVFGWEIHQDNNQEQTKTTQRITRVQNIVESVSNKKLFPGRIDIIVFPEYSLGIDCLSILQEFSKTRKTIVIAGYYNHETRKSSVMISVPNGDNINVYHQEKLTISKGESDFVEHSDSDSIYYRFKWINEINGVETEFYFQVFICLDFLSYSLDLISKETPGLIIVPMNSRKIEEFYGLSSYIIRSNKGLKSLAVALCNGTDILHQNGLNICGLTQIVGPSNSPLAFVNQYVEGGILSTINLATAIVNPTRISEESHVVSSQVKFIIEHDGKVLTKNKTDEKYLLVNPNVLIKDLGLHKIYTLFVADNYYSFRTHLIENCFPIQCNGIFGAYDLLMQAYEESWDYFELRLMYYLEDQYEQIVKERTPEYYEITDVIKFRGEILATITSTEYVTIDTYNGIHAYLADHLEHIRRIMLNEEVPANIMKDLLKRKVIREVVSKSDISPNEKQAGMEEYLLLVFLLPRINTDERMVVSTFQNEVLEKLLIDSRIRTIEFCKDGGSNGAKTCKGTYIFHVVGRLDDLKEIIINKIHKLLFVHKIKCGTRVIPAAEKISDDQYEALSETIIGQKNQKTILKVIKSLSAYPQPFCIKKLPFNTINDISFFVDKYGDHIEKAEKANRKNCCSPTTKGHLDVKKEFELNMYKFVHYICTTIRLDEPLGANVYNSFRVYCGPVYSDLGAKIEGFLSSCFDGIIDVINKSDNKDSYEKNFKQRGINLNKNTSVSGDFLKAISIWNTSIADSENIIGDNTFTADLKKLNGFVKFRNYYSHAFKKDMVGDLSISSFAKDTLTNAIIAVSFLQNYQ